MEKAIVTVLNFTPTEVAVIQVCGFVRFEFGVGHSPSLCCAIVK